MSMKKWNNVSFIFYYFLETMSFSCLGCSFHVPFSKTIEAFSILIFNIFYNIF